ncbi:MAG: hypothetical protein KDB79_13695 [Acidobacteria bacterium]|nr:hypothetical protein [Acidobacteriota bacterium]
MRKLYVAIFGLIAVITAACGSAGSATEVKLGAEKSVPFEVKTAYADMRPDLTEVHFVLANYDFSMKPSTTNSLDKVTSDKQVRITFGLKGEKGEDFNNPVQPGDYSDAKLKWTDIYYFDNGDEQVSNVENRKGKVTITSVTDTEIAGSIDITGDDGKVVKADFKAKKVK